VDHWLFTFKPGVPAFKLGTRSAHEEPGLLFQAPVMVYFGERLRLHIHEWGGMISCSYTCQADDTCLILSNVAVNLWRVSLEFAIMVAITIFYLNNPGPCHGCGIRMYTCAPYLGLGSESPGFRDFHSSFTMGTISLKSSFNKRAPYHHIWCHIGFPNQTPNI
jgi:hypothetical protein